MKKENSPCPLWKLNSTLLFHKSENRVYLHCQNCDLVYVPDTFLINEKEEKEKYDNHQNSPENLGYVDFLNRLLTPLERYLPKNAKGLDFGSGPGPTLSVIMKNRGYKMDIYDYFYARDNSVFGRQYDFITSTEVIEHLKDPLFEIQRLWNLLTKNGYLGIMTAFRIKNFDSWYYKRDLTHIRFFTPKTFKWLAKKLQAKILLIDNGVIILKKERT